MMTRRASKQSDSGFENKRNVPSQFVEEFREFQIRMEQKDGEKENRFEEKERRNRENERGRKGQEK